MTKTLTTKAKTAPVAESGKEVFIPLNKLKKSTRNARKTAHGDADVTALAASIHAKGMFQNLIVEPERDSEGGETGFYFVTAGEGRRLAQLLRVKRRQIKKTEPIRCILDIANDPFEVSLDENVTRSDMHPADQFEAFKQLGEERGYGAEEIAARFGVTAHVVRQRLRLGAVSPKLMQIYRDGELTLEQLMAFAIVDDHARQEQVYENLSWNKEPTCIRRELTRTHIAATDRRAVFVGGEAYTEAGGAILRDLFTDDRGGYFVDAGILDRLVIDKLEQIAANLREAEGWKWTSVHIDFPHAHGLHRIYPNRVELSPENEAAIKEAQAEYAALYERRESEEDAPDADSIDERLGQLEAEVERIDTLRYVYAPDDIARGGVFVVLSHDGTARIERGLIRHEDEQPGATYEAEGEDEGATGDDDIAGDEADAAETDEEDSDGGKPLSDSLIRDLTAHRTLGLRLALGEQPNVALVAVTHALAAQTFYQGAEAHCLQLRPSSVHLGGWADGIEDTAAAQKLAERHAKWAAYLPEDVADLWGFIASLDRTSLMALLAHCASMTVNAVKQPHERKPRVRETVDRLATALSLDMTAHWKPTARSYLGRVTKPHILDAVREAVGDEAAARMAAMKKQPMADAAEQLLVGTGWLPAFLRTPQAVADEGSEAEGLAMAAE